MLTTSLSNDSTAFQAELISYRSSAGVRQTTSKPSPRSSAVQRGLVEIQPPSTRKPFEQFKGHAAPLVPLKDRDANALTTLFDQINLDEIEADIEHKLCFLWPEPCWEDDPFGFLQEYL